MQFTSKIKAVSVFLIFFILSVIGITHNTTILGLFTLIWLAAIIAAIHFEIVEEGGYKAALRRWFHAKHEQAVQRHQNEIDARYAEEMAEAEERGRIKAQQQAERDEHRRQHPFGTSTGMEPRISRNFINKVNSKKKSYLWDDN